MLALGLLKVWTNPNTLNMIHMAKTQLKEVGQEEVGLLSSDRLGQVSPVCAHLSCNPAFSLAPSFENDLFCLNFIPSLQQRRFCVTAT